MTSLPSRLKFICHLCAQDAEDTTDVMMGSSSIVQSTSPITLISDDLSELTTHLIWPITTHDYHRWLITNNHHLSLMTMSYDHDLWLMTMTYTLWLWLSHITHDYDLSPLMTFISYDLFINNYHLSPIPQNHHLWLIIHNSSHMSMTSHPWPCLITYDCLIWLSCLMSHDCDTYHT